MEKILAYMWRHRSEIMLIPAAIAALAVAIASAFSDQLSTRGLQITVLGVLGLLLIAEVVDQFGRLSKIEDNMKAIAHPRPGDVLQRRRDLPPLEDRCGNARSIRACGITLRDIAGYRDLWLGLLEKGAKLEFVLCSEEQIDAWGIGASYGYSLEAEKAQIGATLAIFGGISDEATKKELMGSIKWRHPVSPPCHSMLHIDEGLRTERLRVELHRIDERLRPSFELSTDDPLLSEFRQVSDGIWDEARPGD